MGDKNASVRRPIDACQPLKPMSAAAMLRIAMSSRRQTAIYLTPTTTERTFASFILLARHATFAICYNHNVLLSVRPSVRLSVCLSVTLVDCDHTVQLQKMSSIEDRYLTDCVSTFDLDF